MVLFRKRKKRHIELDSVKTNWNICESNDQVWVQIPMNPRQVGDDRKTLSPDYYYSPTSKYVFFSSNQNLSCDQFQSWLDWFSKIEKVIFLMKKKQQHIETTGSQMA